MSDSSQHAAHSPSFPISDLTARLLLRARKPVGVIDVSHPEQLAIRTPGWIQERFEFLDSFRTRYGLSQSASGAAASSAPDQRMPLFEIHQAKASGDALITASAQPAIMQRAWTETAPAARPESSLTQQFRVKRPGIVSDVENPQRPRPEESSFTKSLPPKEPLATALDFEKRFRALPKAWEIPLPGSSFSQTHLQRKPAEAVLRASNSNKEDNLVTLHDKNASSDSGSLARARELPEIRASGQGMHALLLSPETSARDAAERNSPTLSQTSSVDMKSLPAIEEMPNARVPGSHAAYLQRRSLTAEDFPESPVASATQTGVEASLFLSQAKPRPSRKESGPPSAVSREIRATQPSAGATPIVWRKPIAGSSGSSISVASEAAFLARSPHAGNVQLMRQTANGAASNPPMNAPSIAATATSPSNGETDIAYVAEQVSRVIARQFTIERERRGKTK